MFGLDIKTFYSVFVVGFRGARSKVDDVSIGNEACIVPTRNKEWRMDGPRCRTRGGDGDS